MITMMRSGGDVEGPPRSPTPTSPSPGQRGMRHHQVPDEGLQTFGLRRDESDVEVGDEHARVGTRAGARRRRGRRCRRSRRRPTRARSHGPHEVHADPAFEAAATDREDEQAVAARESRRAQPLLVRGVPAVVVDARGELGDVVGDAVGLDPGELPEVAGRVRRVAGAAARAAEEEPTAAFTRARGAARRPLDLGVVEGGDRS